MFVKHSDVIVRSSEISEEKICEKFVNDCKK